MPATAEDIDLHHNHHHHNNNNCSSDSAITSEDDETSSYTPTTMKKSAPFNKPTKTTMASFESLADRNHHEQFIQDCAKLLIDEAVFKGTSRSGRVLDYHPPAELAQLMDLGVRGSAGATHETLIGLVRDTIKYSVKTGHPYFVNQLFSAVDPYGLVGQWLTDALNPSVYTYEVSPVFSLMEETVLGEMRRIVGFGEEDDQQQGGNGDGIFCPGGSMANGYAISCARYKFMPDVKSKGLHSLPRPLVLFTSADAHYSIQKLAAFMGLGTENVLLIPTDSRGRMSHTELRSAVVKTLEAGGAPFMVSATSGTTVLGAFDPLNELADVCEEYGLWLHVDAAWGGGALMSEKYRKLLSGVHRADSVTWNPHKLLTAPQQCSTLLLPARHTGLLAAVHGSQAAYLFQPDKCYDTRHDTGDKHIQCGRRADVLKFWFMWKAKGTVGLERHVDKVFACAEYFAAGIRGREGFRMVLEEPECTNVCFWYIPPSLRGRESDPDYNEKLNRIAPKIKERMMKEGTMMVTYQQQNDLPNFFRIVFQSSGLEKSDMTHFIEEFERLGKDL